MQQRRRRAHLHVEQQPGVSLGRAFGIRSLHGHRNWIHLQAIWPHRDMFACSGLSLRNIDFELLKFKHDQHKITKNITPGAGEDTGHQAILWGGILWFSAFIFLIRMLRNVLLRLVHCECALRVGR